VPPIAPAIASPDLGWQPPTALETQTASNDPLAGVALSSDGTGMVVWQRSGARATLMATHFLPGGHGDGGTNWQVPVQISDSTDNVGYTYNGAVAMDAAGDAMAVYYSYTDLHGYTIYAAYFQHGVGWKAPVAIDQGYDWSFNPVVAMNAAGDAFVVWEMYNFAHYSIFANRYAPGTGWGTAVNISVANNWSYSPDVAVDSAGDAIATWYQFDGSGDHVYAARFSTVTDSWTAPLLLETSTNSAFYPSVALDSQGNGVVAWIEYDGQYNIWAKLYTNGTGWGVATNIKSSPDSAYYYPGPAVSASHGNASVVWTMALANGTPHVFINRYVAGSGWVGETDISGTGYSAEDGLVAMDATGNVTVTYVYNPISTTAPNLVVEEAVRFNHLTSLWGYSALDEERAGSGSPLLAIDGAGNALAAWNYNDNTTASPRNGILTNYYTSGSGWQPYYAAQQAEWDQDISPSWLQLETNPAGDSIFSFTQNDGPISDGYAALYTPGGGWGPVTKVVNNTASGPTEEWSAIDGAGNALVFYRASDGTQFNVYATYYSVGSGWGAPQRLDNAAGSNKDWLRVAMNDQGNGIAGWLEYNGTNYNAYAAFFNGTTKTWSAPEAVQSSIGDLGSVVVGIDGSGNAMAVYQAWNGSAWNNYGGYYKNGVGWSAPVQLSFDTMSTGDVYALTMNGVGDVAASWTEWDGVRNLAAVDTFAPATGWAHETLFASVTGDEGPATPSLDGAGNALLAYNGWNGTQWNAYAVSKPASGAWGAPVQINSGAGDASQLTTSLDYAGNGFIAWTHFNGVGNDIVARKYIAGGALLPQATVNLPFPATSATDTGTPVLGVDGHGDAILGWNQWEAGALLPYAATYIVGSGAPTLSLTSPTNGTLTNDPSVTVAGSTDPGATVTIDGVGVPVAANGSFRQTYSMADGTHTFTVIATNGAGLTTSESSTVSVDTSPPALLISSPTTGSITNNSVATVVGTTEPGASVSVNGVQAVVSPSGSFSVALALVQGLNTISAIATDPFGNSATTSVTVTLDTFPPPLTLTSPTAGPTNHSAVVVTGSTEAGATVTVDGTPVTVGGTGAFTTTVTLPNGPHTFVVVATDTAGNKATVSVTVTVDTTPPTLVITSPSTGTTVSVPEVLVSGTAEPGTTVVVNGYTVSLTGTGAFSIQLPLSPGANAITATATDAAGNRATATITVSYNNPVPAAQASINTLTSMSWVLVGLVAAALAIGAYALVRPRKPSVGKSTAPPAAATPANPSGSPPWEEK
jgi:hypothetical protein